MPDENRIGPSRFLKSRTARITAFIVGWAMCGTASTIHWRLFRFYDPYTFFELWRIKVVLWYLWGFTTLWIVRLSRRNRLSRKHWKPNLLRLLGWSLVVTAIYLAVYDILLLVNLGRPLNWDNLYRMFFFVLDYHSSFYYLAFWATVGAEHAYNYFTKFHERELRASKLETQLAQSRLDTLKSKMNPHFLFNALNAVSSLVYHKKNDEAYELIARIAELLRRSVREHERQVVSLEEELTFVDLYLDIVRIRFRDRLKVVTEIGAETAAAAIPSLILQPLVENAVKHGLQSASDHVAVEIHTSHVEGRLEVEVRDDGPGLPEDWSLDDSEGFGLAAAKERLESLYGSDQQFTITNGIRAGVTVRISIPYREVKIGEPV